MENIIKMIDELVNLLNAFAIVHHNMKLSPSINKNCMGKYRKSINFNCKHQLSASITKEIFSLRSHGTYKNEGEKAHARHVRWCDSTRIRAKALLIDKFNLVGLPQSKQR